jgi:hypothetical protein
MTVKRHSKDLRGQLAVLSQALANKKAPVAWPALEENEQRTSSAVA